MAGKKGSCHDRLDFGSLSHPGEAGRGGMGYTCTPRGAQRHAVGGRSLEGKEVHRVVGRGDRKGVARLAVGQNCCPVEVSRRWTGHGTPIPGPGRPEVPPGCGEAFPRPRTPHPRQRGGALAECPADSSGLRAPKTAGPHHDSRRGGAAHSGHSQRVRGVGLRHVRARPRSARETEGQHLLTRGAMGSESSRERCR